MSNEAQSIEAEIIVEEDRAAVLPPDVARNLTNEIRRALKFTWDLVIKAYQGQAWLALDYKTWNDYCVKEFGNQHIAIPREDRNEVIGSLRDAGLSTRAIVDATGLSKGTVSREIRKLDEDPSAPNGAVESGDDESPASNGAADGGNENSGVQNRTPEEKPQKVQGVNGKMYDRSAPPKPKNNDSVEPPLDGQADIGDALDTSLEDLGITPIDPEEAVNNNAKTRVQLVKRLTGSSGQYAQAPLPMVISLAGQIVERSAGVNDLDVEEVTSFADDSSRAVLVLARLLETIDPDEIDDDKTRTQIEQKLNQAQEYLDNFLTTLTEV
ncbi:helix-turn-helix domain-containing protein [Glutamicibacter sp. AOP5-A2-18]|uniref:helix-turn-helix domain-containing protein n=1 Tax=Glutamicibacter sp. AOP5-A2-18 TaxID=3457656 RepID=UPI0040335CF2